MFSISPLPEYIANLSDMDAYKLLVSGVPLDLTVAKTVSISKTISGGAKVSVFNSTIAGKQARFQRILQNEDFKKLENICNSEYNEWLLVHRGRRFTVCVVLLSAAKATENSTNAAFEITFINEVL